MTDTQLEALKNALSKNGSKGTRAFALDLNLIVGFKKEKKNG